VKQIRFLPNVPLEIRAIPQPIALGILKALHRYIETGAGRVKPLSGEFEGLLRLRVGNYRVLFDETAETVTLHRVRDSKERLQLKNTGRQAGQPSRVVQILRIAAARSAHATRR